MKLIEGNVVAHDDRDEQIVELEQALRDLRAEVQNANAATLQAQREATRALSALRRQLSPLYRALQQVFGELDTVGVDESADPVSAAVNRTSPVWAAWKQRVSPSAGRVIDALMIHGELNIQSICVAATMGRNTVYTAIAELKKAGVLNKNGGRFSLKQL